MYAGLVAIDDGTLKLTNLKVLNLVKNNIAAIENLPVSLK